MHTMALDHPLAARRLGAADLLLDRVGISRLPRHESPYSRPGDLHRVTTPIAESGASSRAARRTGGALICAGVGSGLRAVRRSSTAALGDAPAGAPKRQPTTE